MEGDVKHELADFGKLLAGERLGDQVSYVAESDFRENERSSLEVERDTFPLVLFDRNNQWRAMGIQLVPHILMRSGVSRRFKELKQIPQPENGPFNLVYFCPIDAIRGICAEYWKDEQGEWIFAHYVAVIRDHALEERVAEEPMPRQLKDGKWYISNFRTMHERDALGGTRSREPMHEHLWLWTGTDWTTDQSKAKTFESADEATKYLGFDGRYYIMY